MPPDSCHCMIKSCLTLKFLSVVPLSCSEPLQVVVGPLLQVHEGGAAGAVDVAQCTQPPWTTAKPGLKRPMKERQQEAFAELGETTPKPRRSSRSKKVTTSDCGLQDLSPMLQTPMPESGVGNESGPPPPDSTPARQRGETCVDNLRNMQLLRIFDLSCSDGV